MKPSQAAAGNPMSVLTGHHAPVSGWWRPDGEVVPYRFVPKGALMPAHQGQRVDWRLELETPKPVGGY
ncbi:hypothetical protein J2T11_003148 [Paenarthrobacter nicotinovorans]|nr:hypothetical protein [Paenarthrobacter nicotinovorans]